METVERDVYFQDVRLQMDAKIWGEEFNRHNPPKKVSPYSTLKWLCNIVSDSEEKILDLADAAIIIINL